MMVRVRYRPVPDRIEMYSVLLVDKIEWCIGFVTRTGDGMWTARRRGDDQSKTVKGWPRRTDAAAWLVAADDFLQLREQAA